MAASMHVLFGTLPGTPVQSTATFDQFRAGVEAMFATTTRAFGSGTVNVGLAGEGRVVGAAQDGDAFLVLLGAVHKPLPGWKTGSPLDDPDRTALFLLQRYRDRGLRFLDDTVGAFVVALWDDGARRFILANDPAGMRTVYYVERGAGFAFSSSLYALNCAVEGGLGIDRSLEDFLLGYEFLPWRQTLYRGVLSLGPGMMLEWHEGVVRQHTSRLPDSSPWQLENLAGRDASEAQAGEVLFDLFMRCLSDVLPADRRVAVLLGGFDSALIVAACRRLGREVDTYTFRFPQARYNQAFVEDVARICGSTHHWIDITPEVLEDGLAEYPLLFNQPSGMPHYLVQTAHVLRKMREDGHWHCLTGDGCDEIFLGYPTVFRRAQWVQRHRSIPGWVLKSAGWLLGRRAVERRLGHAARFVRNVLRVAGRPMPRRGHIANRILDEQALCFLRKDTPRQAMEPEAVLAALSLELATLSPLRLAYHGKSAPGLNKLKLAGVSAASGLSVLSPFQHPDLVAFARSLPERMLRPSESDADSATGKRLLMRAVEKMALLPREVIYQRKASPVAGMADAWYMGPLRGFMLGRMASLPFDYDRQYAGELLAFKPLEEVFRKRISLGHYVLNAPALLLTYAAFNDDRHRRCGVLRP
jgi:asparagine synthetase B (glutamine-hydrolysing)